MKKTVLLLCSILIIGFSACSKTEYVEPDSIIRTVHHSINSSDWTSVEGGTKWELELNIPDIDGLIVDHGTVLVDIAFDQDINGEYIYEPLTTVYNGIVFRYDYSLETLLLDVRSAAENGATITRPPAAKLKIFLIDSESIN